ncbi:MAG: transaldolase, partial [Anaerolineae bacterium]|nr:transaldolase [Anaerolineae bacterium]
MSRISDLHNLGQSLWYDNIQRRLLLDGSMAKRINNEDFLGMTSNPAIFNNAIAKSSDYDSDLQPMAWAGWKAEEIFYQLAIEDIKTAAGLFTAQYEKSNHLNGYISLEVSPYLANNTRGTVEEAKKLWKRVNRPNLMVKIPATKAGIPAIKQAIAEGINVNVTLIFSLERYKEVIHAYIDGLAERHKKNLPINNIASVASFFISRFDSKIDAQLEKLIAEDKSKAASLQNLLGKAAIANAQLAYSLFLDEFNSDKFKTLKAAGARVQRPLWASTSTKNPNYRDVIYIEELIAPDTVNTVPPATLDAYADHGNAKVSITPESMKQAAETINRLEKLGINLDDVAKALEDEGVKAFAVAYGDLLKTIEGRCKQFKKDLSGLAAKIPPAIKSLETDQFSKRMVEKDPTLWTANTAAHAEITNRLGWLA